MSAENFARVNVALLHTPPRPTFGSQSLAALTERINGAPDLLEGDWRQLIRAEFELSTEQGASLVNIAPDRIDQIQQYLNAAAAHIRQGGTIAAHIIVRPIEERTPEAVHDVQIELTPAPITSVPQLPTPRMLRIAHCDADCRNWGWG